MSSRTQRGAPKSSKGFVPLKDIFDNQIPRNTLVDVAGIAVDFQLPKPTQRDDWKCTIRLLDKSTESSQEESIGVHLFREESCMPKVQLGDIVVVIQAKVQCRDFEAPSLLSTFPTVVRVYTASQIPRPPANALKALGSISMKGNFQGEKQPSKSEAEFVSSLFHSMDKTSLPTEAEYEVQTMRSANVREKFSSLDKIEDGNFYNLIVEVVRYYDAGNQVTLWISDYTENLAFYNHSIMGAGLSEDQEGDPYGYNAKFTKKADKQTDWRGPFGKRSMQLSCWDEHAAAIQEETITPGSWVLIKNVHVKYGNNGANLEGFLRGERGPMDLNPRVNISRLNPAEDPETIDPRLKDAIRRKRDYERSKKKELKEVEEAAKAGQKRKSTVLSDTTSSNANSKKRRSQKRAAAKRAGKVEKENEAAEAEEVEYPDDQSRQISPDTRDPAMTLNPHVKCEHHNIQPSGVSEILQHVYQEVDVEGEQIRFPLPFVNLNYRADVRITNFKPSELREFAFPKKQTEFDMLSDNGESDSESESEVDVESTDNYDWQWRFFLEMEDAKAGADGEKFWVVVDNQSAQCLLSIDATNLREDNNALEELRQRMFVLWGNLEEVKCAQQAAAKRTKRSVDVERPPDSSDDEESTDKIANRAFPCCIRQYGVKVAENDPDQANAGEGHRWERVYGMFGTRILTAV